MKNSRLTVLLMLLLLCSNAFATECLESTQIEFEKIKGEAPCPDKIVTHTSKSTLIANQYGDYAFAMYGLNPLTGLNAGFVFVNDYSHPWGKHGYNQSLRSDFLQPFIGISLAIKGQASYTFDIYEARLVFKRFGINSNNKKEEISSCVYTSIKITN